MGFLYGVVVSGIATFDLSKRRTGWTVWDRGWQQPRYGSWVLGSEYSSDGQVYATLHQRMAELRQVMPFDTIYIEDPINAANLGGNTNIRALKLAAGLACHAESFAYATGCRFFAINISTWRKDFVGEQLVKDAQARARAKRQLTNKKASARDDLKRLTMARCRQLGFAPRYDDEGDAIGILDFALDFHEHITPPWRRDEVLREPLEVAV